jgi:hypothetical protein
MEVAASDHVAGTCELYRQRIEVSEKATMMIFVEVSAQFKISNVKGADATGIGPPRACR